MLTLQAFYDWLARPSKTTDAHKGRLARLTRVSREKSMSVASELVWYVWSAPQA
jgi:hypothetical protein